MLSAIRKRLASKRFFVGERPQKPPYFLHHRRVFILPTRQGFGFAFMLFVMLIGSTNYSSSLGFFLTFLLSSLFVVAMFHTYNNLLHLSLGPATCSPVFVNQPTSLDVQIDNSGYQQRCSIRAFVPKNAAVISDFDRHTITTCSIPFCFSQRGWVPLPRFTLETTFPLGLFRAWAHVEPDQRQLVYPQPLSHTSIPNNQTGLARGNQQHANGFDDFRSLRAYVPGDPLKHIHWKNYARHQNMQTKEFSLGLANGLWIDWGDTTVNGTEQKISQLTRWVMLANDSAVPFGFKLPNITIRLGYGPIHLHQCLKQLALYASSPTAK